MGLDAPVTYHEKLKSPIDFQLSKIKRQGKSNISGGKFGYDYYCVGQLSSKLIQN